MITNTSTGIVVCIAWAPDDRAAVFLTKGYAPRAATTGDASGLLTATYPFGAGRFTLNSPQVLENGDRHPTADRLLLNMITSTMSFSAEPRVPLLEDVDERSRPSATSR